MENQSGANPDHEFRILSIDGGGIKGVFPAAFLAELEKSLPEPIYRYFDLVAGTSTGGIIALGLGLGLSATAITKFYENYGPSIFPDAFLSAPLRLVRRVFSSKYSSDALRTALEGEFRDRTMADSRVRLLIPSFNINSGEIHIYKTRHNERFHTDFRVSTVDVALATAAAPTYFPSHRGAGQALYIDGGLWANNPVGNAVVEAISWLGRSPQTIRVLSLGCTQFPASLTGLRGGKDWIFKVLEAALRGQSGGSLGIAYSLVGHERVIRINPAVPENKFKLDSAGTIPELVAFGYLEARKASSNLIPQFFSEPAEPFVPLT